MNNYRNFSVFALFLFARQLAAQDNVGIEFSVISDDKAKISVGQLLCADLELVEANPNPTTKQRVTLLSNPISDNASDGVTVLSATVKPTLVHRNSFKAGCDIEEIRKIKVSSVSTFGFAIASANLTTEYKRVDGKKSVTKETLEITVKAPEQDDPSKFITLKSVVFGGE